MTEHTMETAHPARTETGDDGSSGATEYLRFGLMIVVSMVVMYGVMYLNTDQLSHAEWSETRFYMTLLMGASMAVVMMSFMWSMHRDRRVNIAVYVLAAVVFAGALWLVRSQRTVDDRAYLTQAPTPLAEPGSIGPLKRCDSSRGVAGCSVQAGQRVSRREAHGLQVARELLAMVGRQWVEEEPLHVHRMQSRGAHRGLLAERRQSNEPPTAILRVLVTNHQPRRLHPVHQARHASRGEHPLLCDCSHRQALPARPTEDQQHLEHQMTDAALVLDRPSQDVLQPIGSSLQSAERQHQSVVRSLLCRCDLTIASHRTSHPLEPSGAKAPSPSSRNPHRLDGLRDGSTKASTG